MATDVEEGAMGSADVIEIGDQLLSRAVYFEDSLGRKIRPIFQRDDVTGIRSYRVYPVGNSKSTHVEVFDAAELAAYAGKGFAIRCRLPSGSSSNRSLHSKDIAGRLVVLLDLKYRTQLEEPPEKAKRLPAPLLRSVTAEYVWFAVQDLLAGVDVPGFGPSTDYDLIAEGGIRLPPKQVFGLAASRALGRAITSVDFSGGLGTVCFELLEEAGYEIVAKGDQPSSERLPEYADETLWVEGRQKLVVHLRKERAAGLARAKKSDFLKRHGKLFCELCLLDPMQTYGEHGAACIEVHHHETSLAEMQEGHITTLDQLKCLCANCHRVEHRRLRER
ncbi:hypothetical protein [Pseudomonas fluorescens]|nr:hypothetical protein [Pseudomonas fluorescens]